MTLSEHLVNVNSESPKTLAQVICHDSEPWQEGNEEASHNESRAYDDRTFS